MFQKIKLLFVCTSNINRSVLGASLFDNSPYYEAKSAGTFPLKVGKEKTNPITQELIDWADKIFVMEEEHVEHIKKYFNVGDKKIENLNVPDTYNLLLGVEYKNLREILEEKLEEYLVNKI